MLKYSPPNARPISPQELLVPTTYNPHQVPTFIEDSLDFTSGCPVHPMGRHGGAAATTSWSAAPSPAASGIRMAASPIAAMSSAAAVPTGGGSRTVFPAARPEALTPPERGPTATFEQRGASPVAQYAPPAVDVTRHVAPGYSGHHSLARGFSRAGALPPPTEHHPGMTYPNRSYLPEYAQHPSLGYTPTYPPYADSVVSPLHASQGALHSHAPHGGAHVRGRSTLLPRDGGSASGMVDVRDPSLSEGYTTVSALRRVRPTKQCC